MDRVWVWIEILLATNVESIMRGEMKINWFYEKADMKILIGIAIVTFVPVLLSPITFASAITQRANS